MTPELKDDRLDRLAERATSRSSPAAQPAAGGSVNVRSFRPDRDEGSPFHYGLAKAGPRAPGSGSMARSD